MTQPVCPIRTVEAYVMIDFLEKPKAPWALRPVPPFPAVAQRVLMLVGQENVHIHQIGDVIKTDPSFSAELLRFANSALFGARREVKSVPQAIMMVGMDQLKTMATMVALNRMVRNSVRLAALRKIWQHSLATAIIAEEAARLCRLPRDAAYTYGLLHNLGALGLMSAFPAEYVQMIEVSNENGYDLLKTERDLFDIDHCAAGAYMAQDWDFPDELAAALATHHDDPVVGECSVDNVLKVSWRLADAFGYSVFAGDGKWSLEMLLGLIPKVGESWIGESVEGARKELGERLASAPM